MKKLISILLAAITLVGCSNAQQDIQQNTQGESAQSDYGKYFEGDKIIDIKISLPEGEYQDMLDNAEAEEYKAADITVDGTEVKNVGFRTKGNLTLRSVADSSSDRYSFRIKLDKFVKGQSLDGLDEFVINNMYSDSSYMREFLSYEALRSIGVDTPKCVFANIYVNDELKGLYLCLEAIDDSYLERAFGNSSGNLYKAEMGSSLVYNENSNYDTLELKNGNDTTKTDLKNMIKALNSIENGNKGDIENVLDVNSALKYIAFNYVFANYDSYQGNNRQNYYLYENNGIFSIIPWDFNMSLGGGMDSRGAVLDMPIAASNSDGYPLVAKLLSVEEYKSQYYEYVKELVAYLNTAEERIATLKKLIGTAVENDPTKFCTLEEFNNATTYSENNEENKPDPDKMPPDMGERPNFDNMPQNGEKPAPPSNENYNNNDNSKRPAPPQGDSFKGRPMGGDFMQSNGSIVNFIRNRIETVTAELNE